MRVGTRVLLVENVAVEIEHSSLSVPCMGIVYAMWLCVCAFDLEQ